MLSILSKAARGLSVNLTVLQACSTLQVIICSTARLAMDGIPQSFVQPRQLDEATASQLLNQLAPGQVRLTHLISMMHIA